MRPARTASGWARRREAGREGRRARGWGARSSTTSSSSRSEPARSLAVPGALTFRGQREDSEELARLLERLTTRDLRRLVFAVPAGSTWPLPLYELAMLTGEYLSEHLTHAELTVVTPEEQPLGLFGTAASEAMALLLETRGIGLRTAAQPVAFEDGGAPARGRRHGRCGRRRRIAEAGGASPRRDPSGRTRLRAHRRVRPRRRVHRRVRGRRSHAVLDQAGRHRRPGGRRRRRGDRRGRRRAGTAKPVPARPARTPLHWVRTAVPAARGSRPVVRRHAAVVVAARQDRRPVPEPLPRRAPRAGRDVGRGPGGRGAGRSCRRPSAWTPI